MNIDDFLPDCAICLTVLSKDLATISCGHIYHFNCIYEQLSRARSCPLCRKSAPCITKLILNYKEATKLSDDERIQIIQNLTIEKLKTDKKATDLENCLKELVDNYKAQQSQIDEYVKEFTNLNVYIQ
jgi:hypothetical protein